MNQKRIMGFTLVELMIVLAVLAIILGIAIPTFDGQIRRSRRSEGITQLQNLQLLQERWRASNPVYATQAQLGMPTNPHYTITASGETATTYVLTATAVGDQTADRSQGVVCSPLTITKLANSSTTVKAPLACW